MIVHIAGSVVHVNALLRQRCAWCGAVLIDYDLSRVAVPIGQGGAPGTWPVGALVALDGPASWTVDPADGDGELPAGACARIDASVTR